MTDLNNNIIENVKEEAIEVAAVSKRYSLDYAIESIEKIRDDTEYLLSTIETLKLMPASGGPADVAGEAKAMACGNLVEARENTNRQLIKFYEKMYDDLKPAKVNPITESAMKLLYKMLESGEGAESYENFEKALKVIRNFNESL